MRLARTALLLTGLAVALPGQRLSAQAATLSVTGAVPAPLTVSAAELAQLPRASVATTSNGITTTYEGVWLSDLLAKAGLTFGPRGGASLSTYVVAIAEDGYQVLFSAGELDPGITDGKYLVADRANGQTLFGENGSFRLVVPADKRGARSVRMLRRVHVVAVPRG